MTATLNENGAQGAHDRAMNRDARRDEQAVLGAMMMAANGSSVPGDIRELLTPDEDTKGVGEHHFTLGRHRVIWTSIIGLMDQGLPFDALAVASVIDPARLEQLGGVPYLHTCMEQVPSLANGPYYATTVANATVLRLIGEASAKTAEQAAGTALADEFVEDALDAARARLEKIRMPGRRDAMVAWGPLSADANTEMERLADEALNPASAGLSEFSTPWPELNEMLGPVAPGALILIAARPGLGKSVVSRDIAIHLGMRKKLPTLLMSLEMAKLEIALAITANIAKVPLQAIKNGTISDDDWLRIARKYGEFQQSTLEIDDTPRINNAYLQRALNAVTRKYGRPPAAYIWDYLQLGSEKGHNNRQEEVSAMSRGHKLAAKEHGTVAVVLSQLNRASESRPDKRPLLSDLRESGSLEQDADVVILLHRDDYYDKECPNAGEMELIVAKNRSGPTGVVTVGAQLHLQRIVSMAL